MYHDMNMTSDMYILVHKQMSIFNLQRFVYNIRKFDEYFFNNKNLLSFVTIGDNTSTTVHLKSLI